MERFVKKKKKMLLFSRAKVSEKAWFPPRLERDYSGRTRLQSEGRLLPPLPSKRQASGQRTSRGTELGADLVTFSGALALAVFWLLRPEGCKFSVPLRSRRRRTGASRPLPRSRWRGVVGGDGHDNPSQLLQYWITVCH